MLLGRNWRAAAAALLLLACALWTLPASAQSTSDELARRHFDSGVAYLEESDYDNALKAFQKSHDLSKRPEILLNIATVHERRGDLPAAVAALSSYLEAAPSGEHAETVKLRIQNLEKRLQEQQPAPQPAAAPLPPAAAPAPAPLAASAPPAARPETAPPSPALEPNRLPAFIALGAGGLMAGGAVLTGILAQSEYQGAKDPSTGCSPTCSDDQLSSGRTLAVTSTVLTGGAVVGVGLGVALLLITGPDPERTSSARPRLDVALGPRGAGASAAWRFW